MRHCLFPGLLLFASCGPAASIAAKRFDGTLGLWDWARSDPIVAEPLPIDVSIPLPVIEAEAGADGIREIERAFATSLQRTHVHYTTGKRMFRSCSSTETEGAYRVLVRMRVSQFDGQQLTGVGTWQLVSPSGGVLLAREQPLSQRLENGATFEDYSAYYYLLVDAVPIVKAHEASRIAAASPVREPAAAAIVAVFDVQDAAKLLQPAELDQLTEYLTVKLTETMQYRVVPRTQIRERLRQEKAGSYEACYDEGCQIELGKNLAAGKSLSTKLLQVGKNCVLTSTLFDLKTETTERAASVTTECAVNAMLAGIEQIAGRLGQR